MADLEIDAAAWLAASDPLAFCKAPDALESKLPLDRILNSIISFWSLRVSAAAWLAASAWLAFHEVPEKAIQLETGG